MTTPEPMASVKMLEQLGVDIHVDGPTVDEWKALARRSYISGATTNPSLMRKIGVTDYETFAKSFLEVSQGKPVSFEVIADEWPEMRRQALKLASWGDNVLVKIPVTNTKGESARDLVWELGKEGVKVNLTAVTDYRQLDGWTMPKDRAPAVISVFAGRITDAGDTPDIVIDECLARFPTTRWEETRATKVLWASTREVSNIKQAARCGCQIITVPLPILAKAVEKFGCDLEEESLSLVQQFHRDAVEAGYSL